MRLAGYRPCRRTDEGKGDDHSFVTAPRKPPDPRPASGIELPEPLSDDHSDDDRG